MLMFCICFIMALPFNFFPGKLFVLNVLEEYKRQSFSKSLERKLARENEAEDMDDSYVNGPPEMNVSYFQGAEEINVARDMDAFSYNTVVIIYALLVAIAAIKCDDLTLIFGMFGSLSETWLDFIFPAILFFSALNHVKSYKTNARIPVIILGLAGFGYVFLGNY